MDFTIEVQRKTFEKTEKESSSEVPMYGETELCFLVFVN